MNDTQAPTLLDVARAAGVSRATVDRVINGRPNVKAKTLQRVREAMERLSYRPDPLAAGLARRARYRFCFLLPAGTNAFMDEVAAQVAGSAAWLAGTRASIERRFVDVFDPFALAGAIDAVDRGFDGAAIVALDEPHVRAAVDRLVADGIPVVTLISDAPASRRLGFVGVDNAAAGRTAAALLGRFSGGRGGSVGVLVGSLSLRDHVDRLFGFRQLVERDYRHLSLLPVVETRDEDGEAEAAVARLAAADAGLVAIYNAGAGNRGAGRALSRLGADRRPVFVGHELTSASAGPLREGLFDALIAQNAGHEVRSAARLLIAQASGAPIIPEQERIRIDVFIRENMPD
ncbi:LacI family DNA-binding transcriptional regulator [Antarcticirhabdus aurantiaca]|uniref:LacI family DNA-binding transcriptional regulator n=1 Tax=Antarcticirhabdus aurantiaca TaxID=2606717 RepID=A0ACD4NRC0_9HYPH|nr:LacI family DNA-binding transcriptional regulator [Antarcticirhabdus aurantiaca]WAJ29278.1 LacI family DNA-binding transcriptional regulator [Jeongeuplla avenae]